jgi:hypothetical protein
MIETAAGAVSRISDRIMDCPASVIVIGVEFGACAAAIMHATARPAAKPADAFK